MRTPFIVSTLGVLSTGTILGSYVLSRESIYDKVYGHCMLESADQEGWKIAEKSLKGAKEQESSLLSPFKEVLSQIKDKNDLDGNTLRNTCLSLYSRDSSSLFSSENTTLTEQIKKYCGLTIKQRLGKGKSFEKSKLQEKISSLNSHTDENIELSEDFKKVKDSSTKRKEFRTACENLYKKSFLSEKTNDWMLVERYCRKSS